MQTGGVSVIEVTLFDCHVVSCILHSGSTSHITFQVLIQRGGEGWNSPPPPPEMLKLSMVAIVLSQVLNNNLVPDCNLRGSKFKIFLGGIPPDPPSRHVCVSGLSHATISSCYHPVFPLQLKILYETLRLLPRNLHSATAKTGTEMA